ncbi:MAG: hypothetical protein JSW59_14765, partial [Phycisphaerales bacterium]
MSKVATRQFETRLASYRGLEGPDSRAGRPRHVRNNGTILIVTIWVVLVLAGLALVFARSMRIAAIVSANHVASLKAESIAAGAAEFIMAKLAAGEEETGDLMESEPYEAVELGQDYFWV